MHHWKFLIYSIVLAALPLDAADTSRSYIIPNLKAWDAVKVGMPVVELEKLLGQPIRKLGPNGDYKPNFLYPWTYGYVARKSQVFPEDFEFVLRIQMGKVMFKEDPFGGIAISEDGSPTVPKLMSPPDEAVFNHYPRLVDFRWYGASGDYPMKYEIEINTLYATGKWSTGNQAQEVGIPYCNYSFLGMTRGRWRVRAVNSRGTGKWSDYFHFEFKV